MKCPYCGEELNGDKRFCGSCGAELPNITEKEKIDSIKKTKKTENKGKIPWFCQMWFISIIFWAGSFFCVGPLIAMVLYIIRLVKYPNGRKMASLSGAIQAGILVLLTAWAMYDSGADDRAIKKYLESNDVNGARNYISEHYNATDYSYYQKMADVSESVGDYDSAAQSILDYCSIADLSNIEDDVINRLMKYKPNVSEDVAIEIEEINQKIVDAKAEREALKAEAEAAKKEAEQSKAEAEQAKVEAEAAKKEAEQAKSENETIKTESEQDRTAAENSKATEETNKEKTETPNADNEKINQNDNSYGEEDYSEDDYWYEENDIGTEMLSSKELKDFIRDSSNIGREVTFRAKVYTIVENMGVYSLVLDDYTVVYGVGLDNYSVIIAGDEVVFTGVYEGTNNSPFNDGSPWFSTGFIYVDE